MRVSGNQLFDPWKKERVNSVLASTEKQIRALAHKLICEVFEKNQQKENPFLVCAILRDKPGHHAWLNLATTVNETVRPRFPAKDYAGGIAHAETLLDGNWYIASPEEEDACRARDNADREKALKHQTAEKTGEANKLIGAIFEAAQAQVRFQDENKPAAVVAVGTETKQRKSA